MNLVQIYLKLPKKLREKILILNNNKGIKQIKNKNKKMKDLFNEDIYSEDWGKYIEEKSIWYKAFKDLALKTKDGLEEAEYFYKDKINKIKINDNNNSDIIVICLVKNDIIRMKKFMEHYRNIGIEKFAIIDNNSTDGTFEYLKEQKDVDLFQITEKYTTIRRQSWINRIISFYGYNRWYLVVDSDELLVYNKMEQNKIQKLIERNESKKIKRCRTLMLDMYPEKFMLGKDINEEDYKLYFKYFDTDTFNKKIHKCFECITGGMRGRIFNDGKKNINIFLIKYPLIYFEKGDIQYNSHYSYPFYKNFNKSLNMALLHYKFLPKDLEKIKDIVKNKNFAGNSKEYQRYLEIFEKDNEMNLIYEGSKEYTSSEDIYAINELKKIEWEE